MFSHKNVSGKKVKERLLSTEKIGSDILIGLFFSVLPVSIP